MMKKLRGLETMQLDLFGNPKKNEPPSAPPVIVSHERELAAPMPLESAKEPARTVRDPVVSEEVESAVRIFSISELNRAVRNLLEDGIGQVWVRGEISNLRKQSSGHQYFSLKDASSQIACVLFANTAKRMRGVRIEDGREVQAFGRLSVYEARGQYQLVIETLQEQGLGALQAKFEALKAKLSAEGLFDSDRKRALPAFPRTIGVVTSPTGAAIHDFLHVLHRRMPGIRVILHPVRVQGRGAANEIAAAIRDFGKAGALPEVDVIVVTRGGGSIEDLWEFNEEAVARAIGASPIPVVSAVGHEIDFTIADFVADVRAPTTSAAAEILAADGLQVLRAIETQFLRLSRAVLGPLQMRLATLGALERSALFREPQRRVEQLSWRTDEAHTRLTQATTGRLQQFRRIQQHAEQVLRMHQPGALIRRTREAVARADAVLATAVRRSATQTRQRLERLESLLEAFSPAATLARGYTITTDAAGNILRSAEKLGYGHPIRTRFPDGEVSSSVRTVSR
jgi:exodeoxyribonuclease VII large subunit